MEDGAAGRKRPENADKAIAWHTAMRPSVRKMLNKNKAGSCDGKAHVHTTRVYGGRRRPLYQPTPFVLTAHQLGAALFHAAGDAA